LEAVDAGGGLDEGALRVVAHVHGETGAHGVVRGATAANEKARLEGDLGYVRVVQRMAHLFENESRGGLEIQGVLTTGSEGLRPTPRGTPRSG
jgi:hypothetical protein